MHKFQTGDKVKITGHCHSHAFSIGTVGTVISVQDSDCFVEAEYVNDWTADKDTIQQVIEESCLEKVE